ncbi:MAG: metallophosphoesterase [Alphaproteobacteria bacterium]|nr:metallophosphoesterase [Alphaproteobacteria bacterium]
MTKAVTTLAQISDVHLPYSYRLSLRDWNIKRALGFLNWQRGRRFVHRQETVDMLIADMKAQRPDHITVTGDLVNLGLPQEYHAAETWLQSLGTPETVTVIPGNHDIYCPVPTDQSCCTSWSAYMSSDALGQSIGFGGSGGFPYVRQVGPVGLICVNSAMPTPPFVARGRVGGQQRDALSTAVHHVASAGLLAVVLIHHPPLVGLAPKRRALEDADQLAALIAQNPIDLVLYGHNHRDSITWVSSSQGVSRPVAVCGAASGSAARRHKGEPLARYYLYEVRTGREATRVSRICRGLSEPHGTVVEIERQDVLVKSAQAGKV